MWTFAVAVIPAIVLIVYIMIRDKYEHEPIGKIVLAFFVGMVSIPLDLALISIFDLDELPYLLDGEILQQVGTAFFSAAIPEEISKFVILFLLVWWSKDFNERMDGIVYAVCIGMGFAGIENVLYLYENYDNWLGVGIGRALLAIPGHFFFAILMGYFYSLAHFASSVGKKPMYLLLAIGVPVLAHGLYDGFLMVQSVLPDIACLLTFAVLFLLNRLRKISKKHIAHLLQKDGVA